MVPWLCRAQPSQGLIDQNQYLELHPECYMKPVQTGVLEYCGPLIPDPVAALGDAVMQDKGCGAQLWLDLTTLLSLPLQVTGPQLSNPWLLAAVNPPPRTPWVVWSAVTSLSLSQRNGARHLGLFPLASKLFHQLGTPLMGSTSRAASSLSQPRVVSPRTTSAL